MMMERYQCITVRRHGVIGDEPSPQREGVRLLPVSVDSGEPAAEPKSAAAGVTINIEITGRALVSLEGAVDAEIVRAVMESLRG